MNILVSACLAGLDCKYNGKNNLSGNVVRLMDKYTVVPVCPEQLGGLPTPRHPAEIKCGKVINTNGADVTAEFEKGAEEALQTAIKYNCMLAVLKSNSPSCGCGKIYDGSFSKILIDGNGIFCQKLLDNNIKVLSENDDFDFLLE